MNTKNFTEDERLEFKQEAAELLDGAERSLLAVDRGEASEEHYGAIFRACHSIKGAAGMMELSDLQRHLHQLETLLTDCKENGTLSRACIELFLRGIDAARALLRGETVAFDYSPRKGTLKPPREKPPVRTEPRGKVVVVDDEPDLLELMCRVLRDADLEVEGTEDPREVEALVERFRPDAVLTDISMPGMNGTELLKILAGKFPDLPIVFVSGHVTKECLISAIDSGVHGVIEKPFDYNRLIDTALGAVRRHQLLRLLDTSVNLLMYQFSDLDDFLKKQGKNEVRTTIQNELNNILEQRRRIRGRTAIKNGAG